MVKSKQLKILRKELARVEKIANPFADLSLINDNTDPKRRVVYTVARDMTAAQLQDCYRLWEINMGDLYRASSFGFDEQDKRDELGHRAARHLLVYQRRAEESVKEEDTTNKEEEEELVAFLHFRFCHDDDQYPECVVLYVYELQVAPTMQRQGWGQRLMGWAEQAAAHARVEKIVLTVFTKNKAAVHLYTTSLQYQIDATSPSQHGEYADYEILSKSLILPLSSSGQK